MANKNEALLKLAGTLSPLFVSCVLLAAQWGSVQTKMQVFEERLDKIVEMNEKQQVRTSQAIEKTSDTLVSLQKDMSYIRGKMKDEGQ